MNKLRHLLAIAFQLCFYFSIFAQSDSTSQKFDSPAIEELKLQEQYDYDRVIEKPRSEFIEFIGSVLSAIFDFITSTVGVVSLVIVLGFIILLAAKGTFKRKKKIVPIKDEVIFSNDTNDENIIGQLNELIQEAIASGNFKQAIRYQFIKLLKELDQQQLIVYHIDKTNYQYSKELPKTMRKQFMMVSKIFDYTWYGDYPANQALFRQMEQLYKRVNTKPDVA